MARADFLGLVPISLRPVQPIRAGFQIDGEQIDLDVFRFLFLGLVAIIAILLIFLLILLFRRWLYDESNAILDEPPCVTLTLLIIVAHHLTPVSNNVNR